MPLHQRSEDTLQQLYRGNQIFSISGFLPFRCGNKVSHACIVAAVIVQLVDIAGMNQERLRIGRRTKHDLAIRILYPCGNGAALLTCPNFGPAGAEKGHAHIRQMAAVKIPAAEGCEGIGHIGNFICVLLRQLIFKLPYFFCKADGGAAGAENAALCGQLRKSLCLGRIAGKGLVHENRLAGFHAKLSQSGMLVTLPQGDDHRVHRIDQVFRGVTADHIGPVVQQLRCVRTADVGDAVLSLREQAQKRLPEKVKMLAADADDADPHTGFPHSFI